jgi:uncharacterized membrane protein YiaA
VYKEGVGLFVWAKLPDGVISRSLLIESCMKSILLHRNYFLGVMVKGTFGFTLCVKKKNEAISRF